VVKKLGWSRAGFILAALIFGTNWLSAQRYGYPWAWCLGEPIISPIVEPWMFLIHLIALGYLCVCALKPDPLRLMGTVMVCVLAFGTPTFAEILFRLGKSCQ